MVRFFQSLELGRYSFWIGFITGALFWWFVSKLNTWIPQFREMARSRAQTVRQGIAASTDVRLRRDILRQAQKMHLATPLFSLDEILITPRVLAPPPPVIPGEELPIQSIASQLIPYMVDSPELAQIYSPPTMTLPEVLKGGASLALLGNPGMGKTVALANLASMLARQDAEVGELKDLMPFLVHAGEFSLISTESKEPLELFQEIIAEHVSTLTLPRLPSFIQTTFESGHPLILMDGLDDLAPKAIDRVIHFLEAILKKYPQTRMVVTASPLYFNGLTALGLEPVTIAGWDEHQKADFIKKWGELWTRYISREDGGGQKEVNPALLNGWLSNQELTMNPLELTLKVWAAYAGDVIGPSNADSIEAYVVRMSAGSPKARPVIEKLATQMVLTSSSVISIREAEKYLPESAQNVPPFDESSFAEEKFGEGDTGIATAPSGAETTSPSIATETQIPAIGSDTEQSSPFNTSIMQTEEPELKSEPPPDTDEIKPDSLDSHPNSSLTNLPIDSSTKTTKTAQAPTIHRVLPDLVDSGLLVNRKNNNLSFIHSTIAGYLAGTALASSGETDKLVDLPDWNLKSLTLRYLSSCSDQTERALPMLGYREDPLYRQLLTLANWLKDSPKNAQWRPQALRRLSGLLQQDILPIGLRARFMMAVIASGDPGVPMLLRSLLSKGSPTVRQLAALGCGVIRDPKNVRDLGVIAHEPETNVAQAAVLALMAIGTRHALDEVAAVLLQGAEEVRRAAAEALATNPEEGHLALTEGSTMEDLLVRRAVVYGLIRIKQPWAIQILEKMEIEDSQWIVRTAASQALEEVRKPDTHIPKSRPPLHQVPWLIVYASKLGIGVAPGKPAVDLLIMVLKNGDTEQRFAAMEYLMRNPTEAAIQPLYDLLYGSEGNLREAVYNTLQSFAASGIHLPSPTQFGLGAPV